MVQQSYRFASKPVDKYAWSRQLITADFTHITIAAQSWVSVVTI